MGIRASYRRISEEELFFLLSHPETADSFFGYDEEIPDDEEEEEFLSLKDRLKAQGMYLDIDNNWHVIHFLLTNNSTLEPNNSLDHPLGKVVLGGENTPFDATYGKVRYLLPSEVQEIATLLKQLSVDDLRTRLNPEEFNKAGIYPGNYTGGWNLKQLEIILEKVFPKLVKFFIVSSEAKDALILSLN